MGIETWIALGILAIILGLAVGYIIKAKKSGKKCIGCPEGGCTVCHCACNRKAK